VACLITVYSVVIGYILQKHFKPFYLIYVVEDALIDEGVGGHHIDPRQAKRFKIDGSNTFNQNVNVQIKLRKDKNQIHN
jgi:hypothetical protein